MAEGTWAIGQDVRVFEVNAREGVDQPEGGWPGTVVEVGTKFAIVHYDGRDQAFSLIDGTSNDSCGRRRVRTLKQVRETERRERALEVLQRHGLITDSWREPSLGQLEALAVVLDSPGM